MMLGPSREFACDMRMPNQAGGEGNRSRRKYRESRTRVQTKRERERKHVETATTHRFVTLKNRDGIKNPELEKKYKEDVDMWGCHLSSVP